MREKKSKSKNKKKTTHRLLDCQGIQLTGCKKGKISISYEPGPPMRALGDMGRYR